MGTRQRRASMPHGSRHPDDVHHLEELLEIEPEGDVRCLHAGQQRAALAVRQAVYLGPDPAVLEGLGVGKP